MMLPLTGFGACLAIAWLMFTGHGLIFTALLAALFIVAAVKWALFHGQNVPRHRVRHHRIRVRLHLHPGRGHATAFELWLRWGRLASFRESSPPRPSPRLCQRGTRPARPATHPVRAHDG